MYIYIYICIIYVYITLRIPPSLSQNKWLQPPEGGGGVADLLITFVPWVWEKTHPNPRPPGQGALTFLDWSDPMPAVPDPKCSEDFPQKLSSQASPNSMTMNTQRLGVNLRSNTYLGSASVDSAAKGLQQGMVADASHRSRRGSSVPRGFIHTFPKDFYHSTSFIWDGSILYTVYSTTSWCTI